MFGIVYSFVLFLLLLLFFFFLKSKVSIVNRINCKILPSPQISRKKTGKRRINTKERIWECYQDKVIQKNIAFL